MRANEATKPKTCAAIKNQRLNGVLRQWLVPDTAIAKNSPAFILLMYSTKCEHPQNDVDHVDPPPTIEPCSHRPAEYAYRNALLSILSFGNYG
jgi:hypothetical protein